MKILILSDSHSRLIKLDLTKYDYIIHAGDKGISKDLINNLDNAYSVCGNCDFEGEKTLSFNIDGYNIFLTHGDLFGVKNSLDRLIYRGLIEDANIVIYGHTHIANVFYEGDALFINPGAYMNGNYAEIIDDTLYLHDNNGIYKKIKIRS